MPNDYKCSHPCLNSPGDLILESRLLFCKIPGLVFRSLYRQNSGGRLGGGAVGISVVCKSQNCILLSFSKYQKKVFLQSFNYQKNAQSQMLKERRKKKSFSLCRPRPRQHRFLYDLPRSRAVDIFE